MKIAIIDYGSGNLHSAHKAFERAASESGLGGEMIVTSDPDIVRTADGIVLPGVGAFADCRLGWIGGDVVEIKPNHASLKIPHMGWNTLDKKRAHPLLAEIPTGPDGLHAYFVHSFHVNPSDPNDVIATSSYGGAITALVAKGTVAGTQFHPEKSQKLGLALIANFLRWRP